MSFPFPVRSASPAQAYRARITRTQALRRFSQLAFTGLIGYAAVAHHLATVDGATASLDALCPFGGVETLWRWLSTGGQFVAKTHLSNPYPMRGPGKAPAPPRCRRGRSCRHTRSKAG